MFKWFYMFEKLRGRSRHNEESEPLSQAELGVLENEVLRDGQGASFTPLSDEALGYLSLEDALAHARDLFSTLPFQITHPWAKDYLHAVDLMGLTDDEMSKYLEVIRIMETIEVSFEELYKESEV